MTYTHLTKCSDTQKICMCQYFRFSTTHFPLLWSFTSTWPWRRGPEECSDRSGQGLPSQPQRQVRLYDKTQFLGAHSKSRKNNSSPATAELQRMTDSGKASLDQEQWHATQEALSTEQLSGLACLCDPLLHLNSPTPPAAACALSRCLHISLSLFWQNRALHYCWFHSIQLRCKRFSLSI